MSATVIVPPLVGPNPSLTLMKVNDVQLVQRPVPTLLPAGHVVLEMKAVGICQSDVHYVTHGRIGSFVCRAPMCLGHEASGLVVRAAPDVLNVEVGDRVAIEPGVACGSCVLCRSGRYNLCPQIRFFATPPYDGCLSRYVVHPAMHCHSLETLSYEQGALVEPMSVAVMAANRGHLKATERVLVIGAGPIGMMVALVCKAYAASFVAITDISPSRLKQAQNLGVDEAINVANQDTKQVVDLIVQQYGQFDVVFEAVGTSTTMNVALGAAKSGGRIVAIGLAQTTQTIDIGEAICREIDIIGLFRYVNTWPTCLALLKKGSINTDPLLTHVIQTSEGQGTEYRLNYDKLMEGIEIARTGRDNSIKVMFLL